MQELYYYRLSLMYRGSTMCQAHCWASISVHAQKVLYKYLRIRRIRLNIGLSSLLVNSKGLSRSKVSLHLTTILEDGCHHSYFCAEASRVPSALNCTSTYLKWVRSLIAFTSQALQLLEIFPFLLQLLDFTWSIFFSICSAWLLSLDTFLCVYNAPLICSRLNRGI